MCFCYPAFVSCFSGDSLCPVNIINSFPAQIKHFDSLSDTSQRMYRHSSQLAHSGLWKAILHPCLYRLDRACCTHCNSLFCCSKHDDSSDTFSSYFWQVLQTTVSINQKSHLLFFIFKPKISYTLCELSVGVFPILIFFKSSETVEPHSAKRAQLKASL